MSWRVVQGTEVGEEEREEDEDEVRQARIPSYHLSLSHKRVYT